MSRIISNAKLKRYSREHLYYEISMFISAYKQLVIMMQNSGQWFDRMARIEALVNHGRILTYFLFPSKLPPRPDDVTARDFFNNPAEWDKIQPKYSVRTKNLKDRADKELSHLTLKRIFGTPKKKAYVAEQFNDIIEGLKILADNASEEKLHTEVFKLIKSST